MNYSINTLRHSVFISMKTLGLTCDSEFIFEQIKLFFAHMRFMNLNVIFFFKKFKSH